MKWNLYLYFASLLLTAACSQSTPKRNADFGSDEPIRKVDANPTQIADKTTPPIVENNANNSLPEGTIKTIITNYCNDINFRNFDVFYNTYLKKCKQYYDIKYCTYDLLKKRFEYLWSITDDNKTEITAINLSKYPAYNSVRVTNNYSFYGKKTSEYKNLIDNVEFFEIDNEGDIINIYDAKNPK